MQAKLWTKQRWQNGSSRGALEFSQSANGTIFKMESFIIPNAIESNHQQSCDRNQINTTSRKNKFKRKLTD